MKTQILAIAASLMLTGAAPAAETNDLKSLLQQGLFEEEANRNLDAAISSYQALASQFDRNRQIAATAIFRLGECYRKLGRTNEAVAYYDRIIQEFSDQSTLATLSRQNLTGLGRDEKPARQDVLDPSVSSEPQRLADEAESLAARLAGLEKFQGDPEKLARAIGVLFPDDNLNLMLLNLEGLRLLEARLKSEPGLKLGELSIANVHGGLEGIDSGSGPERVAAAIRKQLENLEQGNEVLLSRRKTRLEVLQAVTQAAPAPRTAAVEHAPLTDEEQQEIRRIQAMIRNSPDLINAPGTNGLAPLHTAAMRGQLIVADFLLRNGAEVNNRDSRRSQTPLHYAADNGHRAMVELLLQRGADATIGNNNGKLPLQMAIAKGFSAVTDALLAAKVNLNQKGEAGGTVLHTAASSRRLALVEQLLKAGADPNIPNQYGNTPLHECGSLEIAELLLKNQAAPDRTNRNGFSFLHNAAGAGYAEAAELILKYGANPNLHDHRRWTPLFHAVTASVPQNLRSNVVRVLLKAKADVNLLDNSGWTPLMHAYKNGLDDIVEMLLEAGADPNVADVTRLDNSTLQFARPGLGQNTVVQPQGSTVLHWAASHGAAKVAEALLRHGADPNARTTPGDTPLHLAARGGHKRVVELLLAAKADPSLAKPDKGPGSHWNGYTALHIAAQTGDREITDLLLRHKANPNLRNADGMTPLDLAKQFKAPTLIEVSAIPPRTLPTRTLRAPIPPPGEPGLSTNPVAGEESTPRPDPALAQMSVADILRKHGALEDLPRLDRIEVRRKTADFSETVFRKDNYNFNRFTLLELLAVEYGLATSYAGLTDSGNAARLAYSGTYFPGPIANQSGNAAPLPFPDFSRITIRRASADAAVPKEIKVDLTEALKLRDCSKDVDLEWGDVVEIPELDHPIAETWKGPSREVLELLMQCLRRDVQIVTKDRSEKYTVSLSVTFDGPKPIVVSNQRFHVLGVLHDSKRLLASSDLSRVKVRRTDPATGKTREWILDCSNDRTAPNFWLRHGDVVEVPDRAAYQ